MPLVDATFRNSPDSTNQVFEIIFGKTDLPRIVGKGLVLMAHWNPEFVVREIAATPANYRYPNFDRLVDLPDHPQSYLDCIGVVDSIEQFIEFFGEYLENDPRNFIVCFVEIVRSMEPPTDGWRYHKWGTYYGTQNPQNEYIFNDTHIDRVYTFHIYQVND